MGGKPSKGTKRDKRLKTNKRKSSLPAWLRKRRSK